MVGGSEAKRLEALWSGEFGNAYNERNSSAYGPRQSYWTEILSRFDVNSVLEVGCNIGGNLQFMAPIVTSYGVDINRSAIVELVRSVPIAGAFVGPARNLPIRDRLVDMTFSAGVLIHQPTDTLPLVMNEMVRCSRRYVLMGEYTSESGGEEEVPYRDVPAALFRRDYGAIFASLFPEMVLVDTWFTDADQGFDRLNWWMFRNG